MFQAPSPRPLHAVIAIELAIAMAEDSGPIKAILMYGTHVHNSAYNDGGAFPATLRALFHQGSFVAPMQALYCMYTYAREVHSHVVATFSRRDSYGNNQ